MPCPPVAPTAPTPSSFAEAVACLQDALGALNDVATLGALLTSVGVPPPEVDETALVDAAVDAWEAVAALTPFWRGRGGAGAPG